MPSHKGRSVRRNRNLGKHGREGWDEAGRHADTVRAETGLDLMPRGLNLARYITRQLDTALTAEQIAGSVRYTVARCTELLARSGHAPLARRLLDRDALDQIPRYEPPKPVRILADGAIVDALTWLGSQGVEWDSAAYTIGWEPDALRSWAVRRGLQWRMAAWFPARFTPRSKLAVDELVEDLLDMAECGRSWEESAGQCGYRDPRSLERRLLRNERWAEVSAAFKRQSVAA